MRTWKLGRTRSDRLEKIAESMPSETTGFTHPPCSDARYYQLLRKLTSSCSESRGACIEKNVNCMRWMVPESPTPKPRNRPVLHYRADSPSQQTDLRVQSLRYLVGSQRRTVNRSSSDGCTYACDADERWTCEACLEMGDLREGTSSRVPESDLP